ncbi:hypothetical protein HMPREF1870_01366 [Bacteroidales bacterium KA00344]|nr:hypothetical protein HMPREF1870_01366 [Bacteroidales bacterium KA00344]
MKINENEQLHLYRAKTILLLLKFQKNDFKFSKYKIGTSI